MDRDADAVVIGAGLAGLAAARELTAAGASVVVLEARDHVGGRVKDRAVDGPAVLELGAGFVGPQQDRMLALTRAVGGQIFPTYTRGENLVELGGKLTRYSGTIPRLSPLVLADIGQTQLRVERLARRIDPEAPWTAPRAAAHDSQTYASWIRRTVRTRAARDLLAVAAKTIWGAEPHDLSLLYVLAYVRAAGGLDPLLETEGGAQAWRFVGGPQSVARAAAAELGDDVVLEAPVVRIEHAAPPAGTAGVTATTEAGTTVTARRAVVALPPPLAARIEYDPPLPGYRDQLCQRMPMGSLFKAFALYDEPFWRDDGLTGETLSDRGPATITFDTSPPAGSPGVLLGFVGGAEARALAHAPDAERRAAVLDGLARLFGERARKPDDWLVQDWPAEPFSGGGPVAYMPPGTITGFGPALREPIGPLHWAGTETATAWTGYMDGAVRSGERAATEVLAELR